MNMFFHVDFKNYIIYDILNFPPFVFPTKTKHQNSKSKTSETAASIVNCYLGPLRNHEEIFI